MPINVIPNGIEAPQIAGPLQNYGQAVQLKSLLQQNQMQDMQMQEMKRQQADEQASQQIIGAHNGDLLSALPELSQKVSPKTYIALQKTAIDLRKSYGDMKKTELDNEVLSSDKMLGLISQAKQIPPEQYQQAWPEIAQQAVSINPKLQGRIDPGKPIPQQGLDSLGLGILVHSQLAKRSLEERQAEEAKQKAADSAAKLPGEVADSAIKQQELKAMQGSGAFGKGLDVQEANAWLKKNPGKDLADYQKYKSTLVPAFNFNLQNAGANGPASDPLVDAVGQNKMKITEALPMRAPVQVRQAFLNKVLAKYPDFNSSLYDVEKGVLKDFTSGTDSNTLNAFNTAIVHMGTFKKMADALDNGNVQLLNSLGNTVNTKFGSDKVTNFNIAKKAFVGEYSRAVDGAGVTLADRQDVDALVNAAGSPSQLRGAAETAEKLLMGKRDVLKKKFDAGAAGKPNFGTEAATHPSGHSAGDTRTYNGATYKFDGSQWVKQ